MCIRCTPPLHVSVVNKDRAKMKPTKERLGGFLRSGFEVGERRAEEISEQDARVKISHPVRWLIRHELVIYAAVTGRAPGLFF